MTVIEAVKENRLALSLFIENKMYLHSSVPLRVLLCDGPNPMLMRLSQEVGRELHVWTSLSLEELSPTLLKDLQFDLRNPCDWDPRAVIQRTKLPLQEFLNRKFCAAKDGNRYTPQQIIKATANKMGFTHYDEDRQKFLKDSLEWKVNVRKGDDVEEYSLVESHLLYLARWTIEAIDYLMDEEVKFTAFFALDKVDNTIGNSVVWCTQSGGILKVEFENAQIKLNSKDRSIELPKANDSYICVDGYDHEFRITSNLLDGEEVIPYRNIVTKNSLRMDMNFEKVSGNAYLYSRLLNQSEKLEIRDIKRREELSKEIEEEYR